MIKANPKVDKLKKVRDTIKELKKLEEQLAKEISKEAQNQTVVYGERWQAIQVCTDRKGAIDPVAIELKGLDPDSFRKPPIVVYSLKIEPRASDIQ